MSIANCCRTTLISEGDAETDVTQQLFFITLWQRHSDTKDKDVSSCDIWPASVASVCSHQQSPLWRIRTQCVAHTLVADCRAAQMLCVYALCHDRHVLPPVKYDFIYYNGSKKTYVDTFSWQTPFSQRSFDSFIQIQKISKLNSHLENWSPTATGASADQQSEYDPLLIKEVLRLCFHWNMTKKVKTPAALAEHWTTSLFYWRVSSVASLRLC